MRFFGRSDKNITITTETIIKTIALSVLAVLVLRFIAAVSHQLTLIAVSAFLAIGLNPAVTRISHYLKSKSRARATGVAYVLVLAVLVCFLWLVVPPLTKQGADFVRDVPNTIENFQQEDTAITRFVRRSELDQKLDQFGRDFSTRYADFGQPVISTATRAAGVVLSIITVVIMTFMMLVEGPSWYERFLKLQPHKKRQHRKVLIEKMYKVVTGYIYGQVLIAAIAASFALVALLIASTITHSDINEVALAGIVFVFGLIPLIGNTLAAAIVVLFALFESTSLAIVMAVYFVLYQQIENATLQPYIQSRTNTLTPLLVFIAAIIGAGAGGLLGALAAIPVAGCLKILAEDWLNDRLPTEDTIEKVSKA